MSQLLNYDTIAEQFMALPKAARREFSREMRMMGRTLQNDIRAASPLRTGRLVRSIKTRTLRGGLKVEIGQIRDVEYKKIAFYGRFVELGTKGYAKGQRTISGKLVKRRIPARPARPFLNPAAAKRIPEFAARVEAMLLRLLA